MDLLLLLTTILKMTVIIAIGVFIGRKIPLTVDVKKLLIFILLNVALPGLIFTGIFQLNVEDNLLRLVFGLFFLSVCINVIGILLSFFMTKIFRVSGEESWQISVLSALGNTGLIGIPLCAILFGAKGAFFAAIIDTGMTFVLWTFGVMLLQGKSKMSLGLFKPLLNMPMAGIVIGLSMVMLNIQPPSFVLDVTGSLASLATPLAMIYIGMLIHTILKEKTTVSIKTITIAVTIKLIIFPLLALLVVSFVPLPHDIVIILLVQATMPTITTAPIIFAKYHADEKTAAMVTIFSTISSLLTIPVMMYVIITILKL
ncbi:AEC family transporter [Anaerobacillus sp. MEB173]|uniref:AEC family transporter n=1 Tax=Anaerobacillus sp. MEB173 TaxID=3383345 RepID=UPI003F8E553B